MENATYPRIARSGKFALPYAVAVRNGGLTKHLNRQYGRFCMNVNGYLITRDARALIAAVGDVVEVDVSDDRDTLIVGTARGGYTYLNRVPVREAVEWAERYLSTGNFDEESIETVETLAELINELGEDGSDVSDLQQVLSALEALNGESKGGK